LREEKRLIDRILQIRDAAIEAIKDVAERLVAKYQVSLQITGKISETGVDATFNVNLDEIQKLKIEGERRRVLERLITRIKKRLEGFDESLLQDVMEMENMSLSFGIKIPFVAEGCINIYIYKK
jgi:actin-like ATPase involved in cell morphogenesis